MRKKVPSETIEFFNGFGFEERLILKDIIYTEAVADVRSHYSKYAYS